MVEKKNIFFVSLGIFFLLLSHNTLALIFLPVLFLYSIMSNKMGIKNTLLSFTFGLLISSFFILPAVFELSYTNFSKISVSDFRQYFASIELIGISTLILLSLSSIFIYDIVLKIIFKKNKDLSNLSIDKIMILMLVVALLTVFLSSKPSSFLWDFIPSSFIQFPFRFLSYLPISLSFITAYTIFHFKSKQRITTALILLIILSFSSYAYLKPVEFFNKSDSFYSTNEGTTTVKDEYMPKWVKIKLEKRFEEKVEIIQGEGEKFERKHQDHYQPEPELGDRGKEDRRYSGDHVE